jgi:copper resistance protein C
MMRRRGSMRARRRLVIAGCALALLAMPSAAGAHAALLSSTPRWGAVLATAPHSLRLVFSEDVVQRYARVDVVTAHGQNLAGPPDVTGSTVVVRLRQGGVGSYTVRWQMVAADDGHVTEGAFSLGVRAKPLPPAPASGVDIPIAPQLLAWLQFLGVALAGGMLTFRAIVSVPAGRMLGLREVGDAQLAIWMGVVGAVLALHAGLFAFLAGAYPRRTTSARPKGRAANSEGENRLA